MQTITVKKKAAVQPRGAEREMRRTVEAGTVSEGAAARVARQRRALVDIFGEAQALRTDPVYPPGSVVNDTGIANFRLMRREMESMPDGATAAANLLRKIDAEGRTEEVADLGCIDFLADGGIRANGREFDLTATAWGHLFEMAPDAPKYAGAHALRASNRVRAAMCSDYLPRVSKPVVLAVREDIDPNGNRLSRPQVYRVSSENYTSYDADLVLDSLLSTSADLMQSWYGDLRYDGEKLSMDFLTMPDSVVDLSAGDVFKIGLRLKANDIRTGAIKGELVAYRNRCLNLIIIGELGQSLFSLRHTGQQQSIHVALASAFAEAEVKFGDFRHAWGQARSEIVITPELGAASFFEGLARSNVLSLPGKVESISSMLLQSWMEEPGFTRADVVNAVTRATHEAATWGDQFAFETVEREAGALLTDKKLIDRVRLALD